MSSSDKVVKQWLEKLAKLNTETDPVSQTLLGKSLLSDLVSFVYSGKEKIDFISFTSLARQNGMSRLHAVSESQADYLETVLRGAFEASEWTDIVAPLRTQLDAYQQISDITLDLSDIDDALNEAWSREGIQTPRPEGVPETHWWWMGPQGST